MRILLLSSVLRKKDDRIKDFLYDIAGALTKKGHKVMIVAAHQDGTPKREQLNGIQIRRFQYFWPASMQRVAYGGGLAQNIKSGIVAKIQLLPYLASETIAAYSAIREFKPDVVQALWTFPQGCVGRFLRYFLQFRLALHIFGAEPFLAKTYKVPFLVTWPAKKADVLTANSSAALEAAVALGVERKKVSLFFLGGVDTKRFSPNSDGSSVRKNLGIGNDKMILVVGRIVERKGHRFLIEAMPSILEKIRNAKLVIAGDGPEMHGLKALVAKKGLGSAVLFPGSVPVEQLPLYYAACDVFCLPAIVDSRGETEGGQGIVLGEAMAAGKPVVASSVGGIPDAVRHEWNGLLVEQRNELQLAGAICRVLGNRALSKKLAKNGLMFARKELSYDVVVERLVKFYQK